MAIKGERTRQEIIDAARELFAEKGFKDISMSSICEKMQLSRGGLYRHFSSTSQIFMEIIGDEKSFDDRISAGDSALEILNDVLIEIEREIPDGGSSLSLAIYEFANIEENRGFFRELNRRAKEKWIRLIEYGNRTGELSVADITAAAELILYYYQGLRLWSRVSGTDGDYAVNYRNTVLSILTGGKEQ